jgi:hypothetical protein
MEVVRILEAASASLKQNGACVLLADEKTSPPRQSPDDKPALALSQTQTTGV